MTKRTKVKRHPVTGRFLSRADWAWSKKERKARGGLSKAEKRQATVSAAFKERGQRTRKEGKLRPEYKGRGVVQKKSGGKGWRKTVTTYRVKPSSEALAGVADQILKAPGRAQVQVQVGSSFSKGGSWAGTRLTTKGDASQWLQGIGKSYGSRFSLKSRARYASETIVEVIVLERRTGKQKWKRVSPDHGDH